MLPRRGVIRRGYSVTKEVCYIRRGVIRGYNFKIFVAYSTQHLQSQTYFSQFVWSDPETHSTQR